MRYTIRRVGPAHALGLGCVVGLVLALLPALGVILAAVLIRTSAASFLNSLGPLGAALTPRLALPWNTVGLSVFLVVVVSGLFYALAAWLVAVGYNLVARLTGGLALDIASDTAAPAAQPLAPAPLPGTTPKDPTMPLPRGVPLPAPPPAGSMPAGPLTPPVAGTPQPGAAPAPLATTGSPGSPGIRPWLISSTNSALHWELHRQVTTIGSDPAGDVALAKDADVAPKHAEIRVETSGYVLYDLGAASGVYVNGRRVQGRNLLKDGYRIQIGGTELLFRHVK